MKCNYKPPKLTKEEQQDMANYKSVLPFIDRLQKDKNKLWETREEDENESKN